MDRGWNLHEIITVMRHGGFYDRIMSGGSELDRVKAYLQVFAEEREAEPGHPLQNPNYPCFPGLASQPFFDGPVPEGVLRLESSFETIRAEVLQLPREAYLRYAPSKMSQDWYLYLLHHMGVNMGALNQGCPETLRVLASAPGLCLDYPWGDAVLSLHVPGSHLEAHCSVDNLRLRCHLAIQVPEGCRIRVGAETRTWQEGRALLFDDSFEHEVWHRGAGNRVVMIVDFWHPDLTAIERRALTAGFRKAEVRRLIYSARLHVADDPGAHLRFLETEVARQDSEPLIQEFWSR